MMELFVNWIVAYLFNHFKPKITYAKRFTDAVDPTRRQDGSLGFDLYTPVLLEFEPGERKIVNTGIIFEFPSYLSMFIWDKSSVALKHNLSVCGGVIDPGYRGCIGVILQNSHPTEKVTIPEGTAVAQAIFHLSVHPTLNFVDENEMSKSERGERGFGGEWKFPTMEYVKSAKNLEDTKCD